MPTAPSPSHVVHDYVFLFDFDQTIANTQGESPSEHKMSVNKACELAIQDMFGSVGLEVYKQQKGLRNRAPIEVITELIEGTDTPRRDYLIEMASYFFLEKGHLLSHLVPEGKGYALELDLNHPLPFMIELFVRTKLSYLVPEISDGWPGECRGFRSFYNQLTEMKRQNLPFRIGIISSGHDIFIKNTFKEWGLSLPDFMVTEDDIRGVDFSPTAHLPVEAQLPFYLSLVKPGAIPLFLAEQKLAQLRNQEYKEGDIVTTLTEERMLYGGDDLHKDIEMARRGGIVGVHFKEGNQGMCIEQDGFFIELGNWKDLARLLQHHSRELLEGQPFHTIFREFAHRHPESQIPLGKERKR